LVSFLFFKKEKKLGDYILSKKLKKNSLEGGEAPFAITILQLFLKVKNYAKIIAS